MISLRPVEHESLMEHRGNEGVTVLQGCTEESNRWIGLFFNFFRRNVFIFLQCLYFSLECKTFSVVVLRVQSLFFNSGIEIVVSMLKLTFSQVYVASIEVVVCIFAVFIYCKVVICFRLLHISLFLPVVMRKSTILMIIGKILFIHSIFLDILLLKGNGLPIALDSIL